LLQVHTCICRHMYVQHTATVCCSVFQTAAEDASTCKLLQVYKCIYVRIYVHHSAVVCCIVLQRVVESGSLSADCSTCLDICVFCVLHIHLCILFCVYMWCLFLRLRIYACTTHYSSVLQCTAENCRESVHLQIPSMYMGCISRWYICIYFYTWSCGIHLYPYRSLMIMYTHMEHIHSISISPYIYPYSYLYLYRKRNLSTPIFKSNDYVYTYGTYLLHIYISVYISIFTSISI